MPRRKPRKMSRKPKGLTQTQTKAVRAIARDIQRSSAEKKTVCIWNENRQLFHNKPDYIDSLLNTTQGLTDAEDGTGNAIRDGDELYLRNLNVRLWLSNKLDRPNVMYKAYLFWHDAAVAPSDASVFFTQGNKMLDRVNTEHISVIDSKTIFSKEMYLNGTEKFEHSYLCTLNGNWKGKKIQYTQGGSSPMHKNIALCVVCYDAYGTLQTDNIASYAYNFNIKYNDN